MGTVTSPRAAMDYERAGDHGKTPVKLWLRLFSCATLIETEISRRLRANFDISIARFDFMAQLYRSGDDGLTMSELSRCLMVTGGNITGLTDRLQNEGIAERSPHPTDRRSQVIRLTSGGRAGFEAMADAHADWMQELMGGLESTEHTQLMKSLASLKHSVVACLGEQET